MSPESIPAVSTIYEPLITVLGVFLANAAIIIPLFLWTRAESRSDSRHMENKLESYRQETNSMIRAIQEEMKDFHQRLCKIEEARK